MDRQKPWTNGQIKAIRQNHTQKPTHTQSQKEKKEIYIYTYIHTYIYIYRCSQSPLPKFWDDSLSIQVFHRCRYIKLIVDI